MRKKVAVLFSGGKDSSYALFLADKYFDVSCLITIASENKESFMFHTPNIQLVKRQAEVMNLPVIFRETKGEKEKELADLKKAIVEAKKKYKIEGVVSGAINSVYQSSRIQKICNDLGIECYNPLWQKNQVELLRELLKNRFEVLIVGVFAEPIKHFLGKKIDEEMIMELEKMQEKWKINPAGEGGEFESFVLYMPLFRRRLEVHSLDKTKTKNGEIGRGEIVDLELKIK